MSDEATRVTLLAAVEAHARAHAHPLAVEFVDAILANTATNPTTSFQSSTVSRPSAGVGQHGQEGAEAGHTEIVHRLARHPSREGAGHSSSPPPQPDLAAVVGTSIAYRCDDGRCEHEPQAHHVGSQG